jgi:hypothetical protein
MKTYEVVSISEWFFTSSLKRKAQEMANQKSQEGYEIISISFGFSIWLIPTAYLTIAKN